MTTPRRPGTPSFVEGRAGAPAMPALVTRLRAAAGRMVPFSEARLLLLEAAATIERLTTR